MKKFSLWGLMLLFGFSIFMTSCSKDDEFLSDDQTETIDPTETNVSNDLVTRSVVSESGLELDCFEILYPFSFSDTEGGEHEIASDDELEALLSDDTLVETFVDFVYPLDVQMEDGEELTVDTSEELGELFALCVPGGGWDENDFPAYLIDLTNSCYTLVYPVSLENLAGDIEVANSEGEYISLIAEEPMLFVFPFDLIHEDGETVTVTDVESLFGFLLDCNPIEQDSIWDYDNGFEYIGCYLVEFPLSVVNADGEVIIVNDHMELCDLMLTGELVGYAYPMTLIDEDGNEVVVNSEDELNDILDDCFTDEGLDFIFLIEGAINSGSGGPDPCYTINFPIEVESVNADGTTETTGFDSLDEALSHTGFVTSLVYPITVTMSEDGSEVELNGITDIIEVLETCN